MQTFVQITPRTGVVRLPRGETPDLIELTLESNQRILRIEFEEINGNRRRKTVDWKWTLWIENDLGEPVEPGREEDEFEKIFGRNLRANRRFNVGDVLRLHPYGEEGAVGWVYEIKNGREAIRADAAYAIGVHEAELDAASDLIENAFVLASVWKKTDFAFSDRTGGAALSEDDYVSLSDAIREVVEEVERLVDEDYGDCDACGKRTLSDKLTAVAYGEGNSGGDGSFCEDCSGGAE